MKAEQAADIVACPVKSRVAVILCVALLVLFAAISWSAVATKSATTDEPMHALAGWLWTHERDFRLDPEDPPLWGYWMSLPNGGDALHVDFNDDAWRAIPQTHWTQTPWWRRTLHADPANDADALVRRSRRMALLLGIAFGALIASYAWKIAGPTAALIAACLFALDPNFLGHAPLVKNDVAISLVFLALSYALWRGGTHLTGSNALAIALLCGVAMSVKFSGLLALPIAGVLLLIRAILPTPWPVLRWVMQTRTQRIAAAAAMLSCTFLLSIAVVWASYGFRYRAVPDAGSTMNIALQKALAIKARLRAADPSLRPTPQELAATPPGKFVSTALFLNDSHLMPEAWLNGLLYTYHTSLIRPSFLLGEVRLTGWWYYFPLAMSFKTPLATMALAAIAAVLALRLRRSAGDFARRWTMLCLLVPAGVYFLMTLRTNLNIGLRHVLPVYPLLYVAIGWAIAETWRRRTKFIRPVTIALLSLLAAETLFSWPNYIAFFNLASGGSRGGLRLLGDSNLDWGQDLPRLARWQREHPDRPIHLHYFGAADPAKYFVSQRIDPANPQWPPPPAVIAVSATFLQGLYVADEVQPMYECLRRQKPIAVLGGSIYIFDPSPPPASATTAPHSGQTPDTLADKL
ncbi:MAG: hypothetical protein QOE14_2286 [Humisphaera sp.]|nr:hypothetical protein [Humisphaera sp.]